MKREKTILIFGTFDFLHIGHIHFMKKSKALGDTLVVCIARDDTVEEIKGKRPIHDEEERKALVGELHMADEVVLGDQTLGSYGIVRRVQPDIIAVGYDQTAFEEDLQAYIKKNTMDILVKRIGAYQPKEKKSSKIKQALNI